MSLYGWKQLIEWSLQHSCLSKEDYDLIHGEWVKKWDKFLDEVIAEFGLELVEKAEVDAGTISDPK